MRKHHSKRVALGAAAITVLFAGSAFTASNTVDDTNLAGASDSEVSGYTIENISYSLDENSDIDGVTADVVEDAEGATAKVQLQDGTGEYTWHECTIGGGTPPGTYESSLNCGVTPAVDVESFDNLRIVIVQ